MHVGPHPPALRLVRSTPAEQFATLRHSVSDAPDAHYTWTCHDGSTLGEQTIVDGDLTLHTTFVKRPSLSAGPGCGCYIGMHPRCTFTESLCLELCSALQT